MGVDVSDEAVLHATRCYKAENLRYTVGEASRLPFPDASFDVVVSFETIEHLYEQELFLKEIHRVLRPEGLFIVSTPNRDTYSPINGPVNRFHVRELTRNEFLKALRVEFRSCTVFGQRPLSGSIIVAEYKDNGDSFDLFKTLRSATKIILNHPRVLRGRSILLLWHRTAQLAQSSVAPISKLRMSMHPFVYECLPRTCVKKPPLCY